ncbi:hypothetical protein WA171_006763 [Blastocystis sp. BT1]
MLVRFSRLAQQISPSMQVINRSIMWRSTPIDNSIEITFAFASGENRKVKARIGDTLKQTAEAYHLPLRGDCQGLGLPKKVFKVEHWSDDVFTEGGACQFCHVILKDDIFKLSPKPEIGEQMWLDKIARNKNKNSRLACQIRVIKEMNGTTVFVPENPK